MRLAVFTNQFPGPVCTFFARDMRGLVDAGIDVDVFAIYPLEAKYWNFVPAELNEDILPRSKVHHLNLRECVDRHTLLRGLRSKTFVGDGVRTTMGALRHGMMAVIKSAYVLPKAFQWAHEYQDHFDHVLAYWGNYTATCAQLFHQLSKTKGPFSLFLHASIDLYHEPVRMQSKLDYADNVITCSDFNRQFIVRQFGERCRNLEKKLLVHYHGLDLDRFTMNGDGKSSKKVIAVGRFAKQKGFDYLLRAFRQLKERNIDVELELVGDGEEAASLRRLVEDLDIKDRVTFRGWLPSDAVPGAIRRATVLAHPSPDLGDGVPNVIKEAMAVGTPVIGSTVAGIPELLDNGKCGVVVKEKDIDELANAIEAIIANPRRQKEYAAAARRRAEERFNLYLNGRRLAEALCSSVRSNGI